MKGSQEDPIKAECGRGRWKTREENSEVSLRIDDNSRERRGTKK